MYQNQQNVGVVVVLFVFFSLKKIQKNLSFLLIVHDIQASILFQQKQEEYFLLQ